MKRTIFTILYCISFSLNSQSNEKPFRSYAGMYYSQGTYSLNYLNNEEYRKNASATIGLKYGTLLSNLVILKMGLQYCRTEYQINERTHCSNCPERFVNDYFDFVQQIGIVFFCRKNILANINLGHGLGWLIKPNYRSSQFVPVAFAQTTSNINIESNFDFRIYKRVFIETGVGLRYFINEIEVANKDNKPNILYFNMGVLYKVN